MKKSFRLLAMAAALLAAATIVSCDDNDPIDTPRVATATIDFESVPASETASDAYGANLYSGSENQITEGYKARIAESDTYVQFPINYAAGYTGDWSYEFFNGGFAVSSFTDRTGNDYMNQCSVYADCGHSGGKFVVVNGHTENANYAECATIRLTDATGYRVVAEGTPVQGVAREGQFRSVWVCNTTYAYLVMRDGNAYAASLAQTKGWFKVVFVGLDANGSATGTSVECYLANFDPERSAAAGLDNALLSGWKEVDLTALGTVSAVAVNFVGSDVGDWGLNTPAYCALDDLTVSVSSIAE